MEMERTYANAKLKSHQNKERVEGLKDKLTRLRKQYSQAGLERIFECLEPLVPYARDQQVKLGFENRYWFTQFPSVDELAILLDEFKTEGVGLWYDVGHSAALEYLNFLEKDEILEKFSDRLIGVHLMDSIRTIDHLAPGKGSVNYTRLSESLNSHALKTLELAVHVPAEEVRNSVTWLGKQGIS
jgi:sugar phosphate isomerase/epimerase